MRKITAKTILKWLFAAPFLISGTLHILHPAPFVRLMPPYLPWHYELVVLSGCIEIGLGLALLVPRTQKWAAWGLIALLIAVFPANIYGATSAATAHPAMLGVSPLLAWLRLPLQFVLIAWAYCYTRESTKKEEK